MTPLLPAPASVRAAAGSFALRDAVPLVLTPGATDSDFAAARALSVAWTSRSRDTPAPARWDPGSSCGGKARRERPTGSV
jgi:hypothetical protein